MTLREWTAKITPPDAAAMEEARRRQAQLAKPPAVSGGSKTSPCSLRGITGRVHNKIEKKASSRFCRRQRRCGRGRFERAALRDARRRSTLRAARPARRRSASISAARSPSATSALQRTSAKKAVLCRKIAFGTKNIARGSAMTREECERAVLTGIELAAETDADVLGVGEMGIGNTTTSSAVLAVLLDAPVEAVTGRGGGVTDEAFTRKKAVIQKAIAINAPDRNDALDVLAKVGGFDLAAMCGAFLGAAATRRPVVIDGLISAVAALCACRICPDVRAYLVPSHASYEIGYKLAMDEMGLEPMLLLGMRLGEGSGCPLAFEVLDAACAIINDMATFDEAGIDDGYLDEIREGDKFTVEGAQ